MYFLNDAESEAVLCARRVRCAQGEVITQVDALQNTSEATLEQELSRKMAKDVEGAFPPGIRRRAAGA